jgi:hypothetical protein
MTGSPRTSADDHGAEPSAINQHEQACRPLADQLLAPDLAAT